MIWVKQKDNVHVYVEADDGIRREISDFFTFEVPGTSLCHHIEIDIGMVRYDSTM